MERSTTAYAGLRCASAIEERRKRDSLLLTHAQLSSRKRDPSPPTRQSTLLERRSSISKASSPVPVIIETETISVVTRGTSPGPPRAPGGPRRTELVAREVKKDITRPKNRPQMIDKQIQSDRLDDSTRYSRFGGSLWSNNSNSLSTSSSRSQIDPDSTSKSNKSVNKSSTSLETDTSSKSNKISSVNSMENLSKAKFTSGQNSFLENETKSKIASRQNSIIEQDSLKSKISSSESGRSKIGTGLSSRQNSQLSLENDSSKSKLGSIQSHKTSLETDSTKSKIGTPLSKSSSAEKSSKLPSATQNGSLSSSKRASPVTSLETSSSQMKNGINRSSSSRSISSSDSLPAKSKTASSSNLPKASNNNSSGQFLPPLPKTSTGSNKLVNSPNSEGINLANKDFRKSVLNMNGGEGPRRRRVESASTASEDEDRTSAAVDDLPSATECKFFLLY